MTVAQASWFFTVGCDHAQLFIACSMTVKTTATPRNKRRAEAKQPRWRQDTLHQLFNHLVCTHDVQLSGAGV